MEPNVIDPFAYDPDAAAEREARRDAAVGPKEESPPDESEFVWCDADSLASWPPGRDDATAVTTPPEPTTEPTTETSTTEPPKKETLDPTLVTTRRGGGVIDGAVSRLAAVRQRVGSARQDDEE